LPSGGDIERQLCPALREFAHPPISRLQRKSGLTRLATAPVTSVDVG